MDGGNPDILRLVFLLVVKQYLPLPWHVFHKVPQTSMEFWSKFNLVSNGNRILFSQGNEKTRNNTTTTRATITATNVVNKVPATNGRIPKCFLTKSGVH